MSSRACRPLDFTGALAYTVAVTCTVDVISIGALSRNALRGEKTAKRVAHATTTLIRDGETAILVDPSLPAELLLHRLDERAGIGPDDVDLVFLTTFMPVHRRALAQFDKATWFIHDDERRAMEEHLSQAIEESRGADQADPVEIEEELALLRRTRPAEDKLSPRVDLFPSPGATPGACGLLVAGVRTTIIVGDAIISREHYENGRVYERSLDADRARQSFAEILDVADLIIPGHDNVIVV